MQLQPLRDERAFINSYYYLRKYVRAEGGMEGGMHLPFLRRIHNTVGGRQSLPPPQKNHRPKHPPPSPFPHPHPHIHNPKKTPKTKLNRYTKELAAAVPERYPGQRTEEGTSDLIFPYSLYFVYYEQYSYIQVRMI